jgi:hypothetical protein
MSLDWSFGDHNVRVQEGARYATLVDQNGAWHLRIKYDPPIIAEEHWDVLITWWDARTGRSDWQTRRFPGSTLPLQRDRPLVSAATRFYREKIIRHPLSSNSSVTTIKRQPHPQHEACMFIAAKLS